MAFTSMGFGQTCSSSILPRWCAKTSFIPSIRSAPKVVFFAGAFFRISDLNGFHVDGLRPDLLQFDFAALVRQNQLHSVDQVRSKGCLLRRRFLSHSLAVLTRQSDSTWLFGSTSWQFIFRTPRHFSIQGN